jgi:hypothetical protein
MFFDVLRSCEGSDGSASADNALNKRLQDIIQQTCTTQLPLVRAAATWREKWRAQNATNPDAASTSANQSTAGESTSALAAPSTPTSSSPVARLPFLSFLLLHWRQLDAHCSLLLRSNSVSTRASTAQGQALFKTSTDIWLPGGGAEADRVCVCIEPETTLTIEAEQVHESVCTCGGIVSVGDVLQFFKQNWRAQRIQCHLPVVSLHIPH